MNNMGK